MAKTYLTDPKPCIYLGLPTSVTLWLFDFIYSSVILRNEQISENERLFMSALWAITLCKFGGPRKVRTTSAISRTRAQKAAKGGKLKTCSFLKLSDRPSLKSRAFFYNSSAARPGANSFKHFGRLRYSLDKAQGS